MEKVNYFLQQLINGISCGSIYAMIAIGYSMVYGLLYLVNFAHGDLYVFGTFIAYSLMISLASKVHPLICCLIAGIITGGIGIIIERTAYRPVRNANRMVPMISAFGVALILKTVAQVIWGPEAIPFESLLPSGSFMVGGMQIYIRAIIIPLCSLAVVVIMQFVLQKTKMGLGTRDIMQDIQTSSLMGIPTNTIIPGIYALGGFLGVFGGVLYCSYYSYICFLYCAEYWSESTFVTRCNCRRLEIWNLYIANIRFGKYIYTTLWCEQHILPYSFLLRGCISSGSAHKRSVFVY